MNPDQTHVEDCALLIVGAGMAGLNALAVASRYLQRDDRVVLLDRMPQSGGMWNEAYDYVRLHQPHGVFTAGNIAWTQGLPREHLARKPEVLTHIAHCLDVLRAKVTLDERYGWEYVAHREVENGGRWHAEVEVRPCAGGAVRIIRARHCIKAFGFNVPINPPLSFSSAQVVSVSPQDHAGFESALATSTEPVYIIGGGKTAMDTATQVLERFPGRPVTLAVGKGTLFTERDRMFPRGVGRWWRGTMSAHWFVDLASRFDGTNAGEVFEYFRKTYATGLDPSFQYYMLGLLSQSENEFIARGIKEYITDYVDDITDEDGTPTLRLRSGARRAIEPGAVVVNCSGFILREDRAYEPYLSDHGCVVSVQSTSSIFTFTTFAAYFLTHLLYLGKIDSLPLYECDLQALHVTDKAIMPFAAISHNLYNLLLISAATPLYVMAEFGLDFDRWYPLPRRLVMGLRVGHQRARLLARCRQALDRVREAQGVRCGVLETIAARNAHAQATAPVRAQA